MDHHAVLRVIFILANLAITSGYLFIAAFIAPNFKVRLLRTRIGGALFFLTCGLTHLEMALHAAFEPDRPFSEMFTSWHMFVIHTVQAASVWSFVTGLYREFVGLPWRVVVGRLLRFFGALVTAPLHLLRRR